MGVGVTELRVQGGVRSGAVFGCESDMPRTGTTGRDTPEAWRAYQQKHTKKLTGGFDPASLLT